MADLVVTVPKWFWQSWVDEGDAAGDPITGKEWGFFVGYRARPGILAGERLYIVAHGMLRGFAPVTRVTYTDRGWAICRQANAEAITIQQPITGFRGFRARWWERSEEQPFAAWRTAGVDLG